MKMIKSFFLLIIAISILKPVKAQQTSDSSNVIKINLSALLMRNISVQYERKISPKMALALDIHLLPFGKLPYQSVVSDIVDVNNIDFTRANIGAFGIIPELRFYPGKKAPCGDFTLALLLAIQGTKLIFLLIIVAKPEFSTVIFLL